MLPFLLSSLWNLDLLIWECQFRKVLFVHWQSIARSCAAALYTLFILEFSFLHSAAARASILVAVRCMWTSWLSITTWTTLSIRDLGLVCIVVRTLSWVTIIPYEMHTRSAAAATAYLIRHEIHLTLWHHSIPQMLSMLRRHGTYVKSWLHSLPQGAKLAMWLLHQYDI